LIADPRWPRAAIARLHRNGNVITPKQSTIRAVAIGASAGGVTALQSLIGALPSDFPAAVLVVQHLDPHHRSRLAEVVGRHARVPVKEAVDGDLLEPGTVYIAPPDSHLIVNHGHVSLTSSSLVHFSRPSVDLLFTSVAETYGAAAIGVVLTGSGRDGAAGIRDIKSHGGITMIQNPEEAQHPSMPQQAYATGCIDYSLPLNDIVPMILTLLSPAGIRPSGAGA
jgi:two-component system, chemotaxis family, protein-glutamate methylesterase/glutaminase